MNTFIHNLILSYNKSENKKEYFESLNDSQKAMILAVLSDKDKFEIINSLKELELLNILKHLDPDEITDILQLYNNIKIQNRIISKLNSNFKKKVDFLLKFAKNSAAGIMSLNYIIVYLYDSKKEIIERLKKHLDLGKREPTILVLDEMENFLGEVRISNLLLNTSEDLFSNLKKLPSVNYNQHQEEVINVFRNNKQEKLVVFDDDNTILGVIKAKDIFKAVDQEDTEDFYAFAGLGKEEDVLDSVKLKVKFRLSWLIVNLATAFLAAFVVSLFEETISKLVILAAFMPIVAGMGGNAATQTTAILIRGIALKKVEPNVINSIIKKEILTSIINGFVIGMMVSLIAVLFGESALFGLIAGISVLLNLIIAAIFGTITPIILKSFGQDPASSSTVFVTTATDVLGFFIFLGLASIFLL